MRRLFCEELAPNIVNDADMISTHVMLKQKTMALPTNSDHTFVTGWQIIMERSKVNGKCRDIKTW